MNTKTILILGGGVGGIVVANELRQKLPLKHRVVLIEKNSEHAFAPSFLWLMTGDRKAEKITKPIRTLVRSEVEVIHAEVTGIDIPNRRITTTTQPLDFDYLIVALGAELAPELIPGLTESAFSFYTFEETKRLQQALGKFSGGDIALVVSALPYKCPGAPHEAAMLVADYFRRRGLKENTNVHLYTPEPQPMPVAGPQLGEAV
ncbi:MAG: FAD-dependent pyridine nucleotide-disulfide oxidoreductase, partial [Bacteroidetes bacterium]|nr:FAD-dependent pyridine nucleotide-disulfide oxidoreductase [Bacteroidota bacterium]